MVNGRNVTGRGKTRRSFLAATGIGATTAFAGCLGEDNGDGGGNGGADEGTIRMRTSESTTAAYAANEGIAAVINEHSDDLFVEAQTSPGTEANLGALNNEEAEMVYIQNWSAREVAEGQGVFGDLDFEMAQIFHFYDLPWFFCSANEDLSNVSDIDGHSVSPTPEGSGTAPALEQALGHATDSYDRISIGFGEQGSAMNEGRLDVGVATYMNFGLVPGWTQEMMGSVDLRVLGADDVLDEWEDDDQLLIQSFDGDELEDAAYTPDEVHCPTFAYNFISRADLDYDTVYNFLETMHEHRSELEDYSAVLARLEEEDFWVENMYDDVPFHAAAADFYEELGLWHDDFERHDEP
ncbi:TAXI family TRAP transporter solute-binding subunit [Natronorubrum sp. DTA7]|uniref:TAXI family TRAP transporter solute-binding subunit n=1 Tax=Natronorubrum sp. DTA7 TaxID=3447016 RepID=UPI003F877778